VLAPLGAFGSAGPVSDGARGVSDQTQISSDFQTLKASSALRPARRSPHCLLNFRPKISKSQFFMFFVIFLPLQKSIKFQPFFKTSKNHKNRSPNAKWMDF
jgi:hypothetical protein